jgi:hypothetical protein
LCNAATPLRTRPPSKRWLTRVRIAGGAPKPSTALATCPDRVAEGRQSAKCEGRLECATDRVRRRWSLLRHLELGVAWADERLAHAAAERLTLAPAGAATTAQLGLGGHHLVAPRAAVRGYERPSATESGLAHGGGRQGLRSRAGGRLPANVVGDGGSALRARRGGGGRHELGERKSAMVRGSPEGGRRQSSQVDGWSSDQPRAELRARSISEVAAVCLGQPETMSRWTGHR